MSRPICTKILISNDRFAVFTNYPSATKDQAFEETVLTLFYPVVHGCFQLDSPALLLSRDIVAHHDVVKG